MASDPRLSGCGRGVLCPVVLAPPAMAWILPRYSGYGALEMAGLDSLSVGVRRRAALRMRFRLDRARHTRPNRPA